MEVRATRNSQVNLPRRTRVVEDYEMCELDLSEAGKDRFSSAELNPS